MTDADDSDGSDEWGMEELDIKEVDGTFPQNPSEIDTNLQDDDEAYWEMELKKDKEEPPKNEPLKKLEIPSQPMIIVDLTKMDPNVHSKHDRNSVNDAEAASTLRKTIEADYSTYAKDASRIADGTVLPCASSVWRDALVRLRDERPGHYFVPIFPPEMIS
jgi:hypothetical protein